MSLLSRLFGDVTDDSVWVEPDSQTVAYMDGYFSRETDRSQISSAIMQRYGSGLKMDKDAETGVQWTTYEKTMMSQQMDAGMIEIVSSGFGNRVSSILANMFTEPTQNFQLSRENGDTEDASVLLDRMRNGNQFLTALISADRTAVQTGSSAVFVEYANGHLRYRPLTPGKVKAQYHSGIVSDGQPRPVDFTDIEDASCVIVETGSADVSTRSYVAIFGRSKLYTNGRYVVYTSGGDGKDVPPVGADSVWEYRNASGEIANPLTEYGNRIGEDYDGPEYPIVIFHGLSEARDRLLPVSTSLWQDSLECDISASHARSVAARNALGTMALHKSDAGSQVIPKSLRGDVVLDHGQDLKSIPVDVSAAAAEWDLTKDQMITLAAAYGIPDYLVSSEDHTIEASSGIALKVRMQPMVKERDRRVAAHEPAIGKLFDVEKALISMFSKESDVAISQLEECSQVWTAGELDTPVNEDTQTTNLEKLLNLGLIDDIEAIRIREGFGSEQEAIAKYEQLKRRREEYPPLTLDTEPPAQQPDGDTTIENQRELTREKS